MGFSPVNIEIVANAREAIAQFQMVNGELGKMDAASLKAGGSISEMDKATRVGTAGLMAMGVAAAAIAVISIKAAMESQVAYQKLGLALANTGNATAAHRAEVTKLIEAQAKLGFSASDTANAYASMLTATGSVIESTKLLTMAEDLARFKHIGLSDAAAILDKATQGSTRAFKELGITLDSHIPKNQAIAKAFDQLNQKIGGEAVGYVHTFSGEMAVLTAEGKNLADKIGTALMPILINFLQWVKDSINWLGQHKIILVAIGAVISTYLILGVQSLTVKLYEQAVAWAAANWQITLIVLAVGAVGAGFVWLWNHVKVFRDVIVEVMKIAVESVGGLVKGIGIMATTWLQMVTGPLKLFLEVMSRLPFVGGAARDALKMINTGIGDVSNFFNSASNSIDNFANKIGGLANAKLSMPDLIKAPTIPTIAPSSGGSAGVAGNIAGGNALKAAKSAAASAINGAALLGNPQDAYQKALAAQVAGYSAPSTSASSGNGLVNGFSGRDTAGPGVSVTQTINVVGTTAPADIARATTDAIKYGAITGSRYMIFS